MCTKKVLADKQTDRQTDRQTDWQTVWQTDTDWLLDKQRQTDRHTDRFYFKTWQPKGSHISLSPQRPKGNKNFTSFGMAFLFSGCSTHLWFHLRTLKKWSCDDKFHDRLPDCVMNETLPLGKLLHSRSLLNWNFLARYNQRHVTEKSSTEAKSIAWIRFASNLVLLRNCNSIALPSAPKAIYYHVITFLNPRLKTANGALNYLEKKPFSTDIWDQKQV